MLAQGHLFSCGQNDSGQLGVSAIETRSLTFVQISLPVEIATFAVGQAHSLAVGVDGSLWGWGVSTYGQIIPYAEPCKSPVNIKSTGFIGAAAGCDHSLAVDCNGFVWGCGSNKYYQLGLGERKDDMEWQQLPGLSGIVAVSASNLGSAALDSNGCVWTFGINQNCQCGIVGEKFISVPQKLSLQNIVYITSGYHHTIALDNLGQVWGFGYGKDGQLGKIPSSSTTPIELVSVPAKSAWAAGFYTLIEDREGKFSNLGYFETTNDFPDIWADHPQLKVLQAYPSHIFLIDTAGNIFACGDNIHGNLGLGKILIFHLIPSVQLLTLNECPFQVTRFREHNLH